MSYEDVIDPMGGFLGEEADYEGIETSEGIAGQELVDNQWAVATISEAEAESYKGDKVRVRTRLKIKEGKTPGRTVFMDLYCTDKMQKQIDGWCRATGLGPMKVRIGDPSGPKDTRAKAANTLSAAKTLAAGLKGREVIVFVGVEKSKQYGDRNRIQGWHRVTDENVEALKAVAFEEGRVVVRKRKDVGGRQVSYLAPKAEGGAGPSTPKATPTATVIE